MKENIMRKIKIERVVLNIGGLDEKLKRGEILLAKLTGEKPVKVEAKKRIPAWGVRPKLEVGVKVTLRGEKAESIIKMILGGLNNTLKEKQFQTNCLSFGIREYIEIPNVEYIREVGIMGLEATVVFSRAGKRIELKKIKRGKTKRQEVSASEIMKFMEEKFKIKIERREK